MKKTLIALALVALMSFAPGGEKKYTLTLTEQQVNALYYALDQSEAAHTSAWLNLLWRSLLSRLKRNRTQLNRNETKKRLAADTCCIIDCGNALSEVWQ